MQITPQTTPSSTGIDNRTATDIVPRVLSSRGLWTTLYVLAFATAAVVV